MQPVTLISAGPGSGKTLSVASWLSGAGCRGAAAWLTVDEADNDLATFWTDVLGALTVAAALPADSALLDLVPASAFGPAQAPADNAEGSGNREGRLRDGEHRQSHLRSIYHTLDVTTRRAAVERARELNLL